MQIRDRIKELRRVPASSLRPSPKNWRTHPKSQQDALRGVLAEIGYADALLCRELPDDSLELIDGHLRAETTPESIVPVLILDVNEEEAGKILATLDPLAAMAEADKDKLDALLKEVNTSSEALETMLADLAKSNGIEPAMPEPGAGGDDFDTTPEESGPTRVQRGELWVIGGKHRLLCGDSTNPEDVKRVMGGEKAGLMNTDPPYGVAYSDSARVAADQTHARPQRERKWDDKCIDNDEVDGEKLQAFLETCIRAALPYLLDNVAFYLWHPMLTQGTFFAAAAAAAADILIHRQIIWVKPSLLFGFGDYHWQHELCFYGWRRSFRPEFYGERNQTTIWDMRHETSNGERMHPTQKPIELFSRPMLNHTKLGELVYEPFAGSGSQFIAAHRLNRRCYGLEIEPRYCDVILKRAEAEGLTVEKAG